MNLLRLVLLLGALALSACAQMPSTHRESGQLSQLVGLWVGADATGAGLTSHL